MTPWMRMLLPVGFGIAAAVINFVVLKQLNQQTEFVSVGGKVPLAQGTPFAPANLTPLPVSGNVAKLNKAWIRWEDRDTIFGRPAGRTLHRGELVLRQDAQPVKELKPGPDEDAMVISLGTVEVEPKLLLIGEKIGFIIRQARPEPEQPVADKAAPVKFVQPKKPDPQDVDIKYLGPFRLLSVGDRLSRNVGESKKDNRGDGRTVTIAIKKIQGQEKIDENVERLVRASAKSGNRGESDLLKLVLHRSSPKTDEEPAIDEGTTPEESKEKTETPTDAAAESTTSETKKEAGEESSTKDSTEAEK
ncbi:MAG: hypothetical protein JWN70_4858 [Planctomycetaceae bacterium]|nr:hypothetical protein [Planctomycetaceae bacterium]